MLVAVTFFCTPLELNRPRPYFGAPSWSFPALAMFASQDFGSRKSRLVAEVLTAVPTFLHHTPLPSFKSHCVIWSTIFIRIVTIATFAPESDFIQAALHTFQWWRRPSMPQWVTVPICWILERLSLDCLQCSHMFPSFHSFRTISSHPMSFLIFSNHPPVTAWHHRCEAS